MRKTTVTALVLVLSVGILGVAVATERGKDTEAISAKSLAAAQAVQEARAGQAATGSVSAAQQDGAGGFDEIGEGTIRIWGENRFRTAVEVSRFWWEPDETLAVYLATGSGFADALAAGPSTFFLGPLLLVQKDALPAITAEELERLQPCWVIAIGGDGVIADSVLEEADAYTQPEACDDLDGGS